MRLPTEEILRRFGEKCEELGGESTIGITTGLCEDLPSFREAIELRNFTGELLKSGLEEHGEEELVLEIEAPSEKHYYEEYHEKIILGREKIYDYFSYHMSFGDIPEDISDRIAKTLEISSLLPEYRDYRNIKEVIKEKAKTKLNRYMWGVLRDVIKDTGFRESNFDIWCSPLTGGTTVKSLLSYRSPEEFLRGGSSIRKVVERLEGKIGEISSERKKIVEEVVNLELGDLDRRIHRISEGVYLEE